MEKKRFIFDLDGTLLKPDYSFEREYFRSVLSKNDAEYFVPMIPSFLAEYENIHLRYDESLLSKFLSEKSGILISPKVVTGWKNIVGETESVVIDGVIETLEYLKSKDKSSVVLTNWFFEPQTRRLKKSGILNYFEAVFTGDIVMKPNPQSYRIACGEYPVERAVMIGDSLQNDVYGAMQVGMDAIYYNSKSKDNFDKNKIKSIGSMRMIKERY